MAGKPVVQVGPMKAAGGKKVDKTLSKPALKCMQKAAMSAFKGKFDPTEKTKETEGFTFEATLTQLEVKGKDVSVTISGESHPLGSVTPLFKAGPTSATASGSKPDKAMEDAVYAVMDSMIAKLGKTLLSYKR